MGGRRGMTEHRLKLNRKYFDAVKNGIKTFEVRKDDRDFMIGDTLYLYETDDYGEYVVTELGIRPTPIEAIVTYILTHDDFPDGVPEGYVILGIKRKR
jgi:hypothetical protein